MYRVASATIVILIHTGLPRGGIYKEKFASLKNYPDIKEAAAGAESIPRIIKMNLGMSQ